MGKLSVLTRGIIKENPVLVLILGTCPALAVSTQASNAIGMGLAATPSRLLQRCRLAAPQSHPDKVRIPPSSC
jgi:electron transport complex protein RnfE